MDRDGWNSIKDKLPSDDEIQLLYQPPYTFMLGFYMGPKRVMKHGFYGYTDDGGVYQLPDVTHWMPLPDIPKEDE